MLKSNESKIWFVAIVAIVGCFAIGDAALAQEKADLSIPAAVRQGKSAVAQQASKRSVGCNCDPLQAPVALKAASAAKTYKPAKLIKLNKLNHRQLSRSTVKFAEVEIVLSDRFSIESISALPRAPGSDLKILDGPRRVRMQLADRQVKALVSKGANLAVLKTFVFLEGRKEEDSSLDGAATLGTCSGPYRYGSNGTNVTIPEGAWDFSPIVISGAPVGATVTCIDVHYEIIHPCRSDLIVDLTDEDLGCEYRLWDNEGGCVPNINETVTQITVCNGELVNQYWLLWAADVYALDTGYINYWWIKVYYDDDGCEPPANDDCLDAIAVAEGVPYIGSTVCATGVDESSCCGYNDTADVWHSFTPTSTGCFRISLCDSAFDTTLAVYNECGGTELACNDDSCGLQSEVLVGLNAGHTYIIRIAGYNGATGSYRLFVDRYSSPPANDDCEDAIAVVDGVPYSGSTVCATGSYQSFCSFGDTADVWHLYTPPSTGTATISLNGSAFDTTLTVFDECGGTELVCNDDISYPSNPDSEIMMRVVGAQTYLIRIAGFCGDAGDYTLSVTSSPCVLLPEPNNPSPVNGANDVPVDTILAWNGSKAKAFQAESKAAISSSKGPITPAVIYGPDDRLEECEVDDPNILSVGNSTVALVLKSDLTNNGDGTFSLPAETYDVNYFSTYGRPLCFDEPFRDQPNPAFCSGFLVAPDIIATAGHCEAAYDCGDVAFVFGFVMGGLDCNVPVLTIDESEIYYCNEVIASTSLGSDWALIRLDREVLGHSPLRVRVAGAVDNGEPLLAVGHPVGLPRKYAGGAEVKSNNVLSPFFEANMDTYVGNSGSAVFNASSLEVEGILVRGNPDWEPNGPCDSSRRCSDDAGCPGWEAVTRTTEFTHLFPWVVYDVYFDVNCPPTQLICSDIDVPMCDPFDPCSPDGTLRPGTTYYWQVVAKDSCGETPGPNDPNDCWTFTTAYIDVNVTLDNDWMYQNLPGSNDSNITACAEIIDDPLNNTSYSYTWEFILPTDVTLEPNIVGPNDVSCCTFTARGCDEPNGISDSGQAFKVRVTVTGDDFGNTGIADANFGIALLGDVNNDCVVNVIDRAIITAFWRTGSAGDYCLRDCDLNCDGRVNVIDRSIVTAIWRGTLCQNDVNEPCPFRPPCP